MHRHSTARLVGSGGAAESGRGGPTSPLQQGIHHRSSAFAMGFDPFAFYGKDVACQAGRSCIENLAPTAATQTEITAATIGNLFAGSATVNAAAGALLGRVALRRAKRRGPGLTWLPERLYNVVSF